MNMLFFFAWAFLAGRRSSLHNDFLLSLHNDLLFSHTMKSVGLLNFDPEKRSSSLLDFLVLDPRGETGIVIIIVIIGPLRTHFAFSL